MKKSDYVAEYFFSIKQDRNWKKVVWTWRTCLLAKRNN